MAEKITIDKDLLKTIHGYISLSDDDSEIDTKDVFDELYESFHPPPIPIDPAVHNIIEIGPDIEYFDSRNNSEGSRKENTEWKNSVPTSGYLFSILDKTGVYLSHFPYENPKLEHFLSFKENFFRILDRTTMDYSQQLEIFLTGRIPDLSIVFTATGDFLMNINKLNLGTEHISVFCSVICRIATLFEYLAKTRNDAFENDAKKILREAFVDSFRSNDQKTDLVAYLDTNLAFLIETFIINCGSSLSSRKSQPQRENNRQTVDVLNFYEPLPVKYYRTKEPKSVITVASKQQGRKSQKIATKTKLRKNLRYTGQNSLIIEDLTQNRHHFYDPSTKKNSRRFRNFREHFLNARIPLLVSDDIRNCDQEPIIVPQNPIIEDVTKNRHHFYEHRSKKNSREFYIFQNLYLNESVQKISFSCSEFSIVGSSSSCDLNKICHPDYINNSKVTMKFFRSSSPIIVADDGQLCRPWGICCTSTGKIIVTDRGNNNVKLFNLEGKLLSTIGEQGKGLGQFNCPNGVCVNPLSHIIVADKDNHRIQIFTMEGVFLHTFGEKGRKNGQFIHPWDVACNSRGDIVVSDANNHRLQLFNSSGALINQIGFRFRPLMKKYFRFPRSICFTPSGNIMVTDFHRHHVAIVDKNFKSVQVFGGIGSKKSQFLRPQGIVCDEEGNFVVADSQNHRIQVFDKSLKFLFQVGRYGRGLGELKEPAGVCLSPSGRIIVVDFANSRIQIF